MTQPPKDRNQTNASWLLASAEFESEHGPVGVAGSGSVFSDEPSREPLAEAPARLRDRQDHRHPGAFAQLIEFGRRRKGWSIGTLAQQAQVDWEDLVAIERTGTMPSPRTVHRLAQVLDLPAEPLAEVAGLVESQDNVIGEAAYRFAARSDPNTSLSAEEEDAYTSFVNVLLSRGTDPTD